MPSVSIETFEEAFEKTATFSFKKTDFEKARATGSLESIAIINKSKHQTNFLKTNDSLFEGFGNFAGDFLSLRIKKSI